MTDPVSPFSPSSGLVGRVKDIIMKPGPTWDVIDGEADDIKSIYMRYIIPLAAIGPVASFLHSVLFGYSFLGVSYKPSVGSAISTAIVTYLLALVSPFVLSLIIDALAPSFGGTKDKVKAFKVAAYSSTPSWVAGIFGLIPGLGALAILGLYSLYLLYVGLPKLMKSPEDKAIGYIAVVIVVSIVVYFIIGAISAPLMSMGASGGSITLPS